MKYPNLLCQLILISITLVFTLQSHSDLATPRPHQPKQSHPAQPEPTTSEATLTTNAITITTKATIPYSKFTQRPSLILMLVIDQLRSDQLSLPYIDLPETGPHQMGMRYLMKQGAYFPFAEYKSLNNMTCPGHATIATGSWPAKHGIVLNEWYDSSLKTSQYCVQDPVHGVSPANIRSTTFADELKTSYPLSKTIGISLKDRSAIALAGHKATYAIWWDFKKFEWTTSSYYKSGLPSWAAGIQIPRRDSLKSKESSFLAGPALTVDLALAAIKSEKLGTHAKNIDYLSLSFSSHDAIGHRYGPTSAESKKLFLEQDRQISRLLKSLKEQGLSLDQVLIVLTSDHGIAPVPDPQAKNQGRIEEIELIKSISDHLNQKFGTSQRPNWIQHGRHFHYSLNTETLEKHKLTKSQALTAIEEYLQANSLIEAVITTEQVSQNRVPHSFQAPTMASWDFQRSGDFTIIPRIQYLPKDDNLVTHITSYSYDRTVPMIFFWKNRFSPGVYPHGEIIDIASTLSFFTGVLPPAKAEGKVLDLRTGH